MALMTWQLARSAFVDWFTLLLGIASAVVLIRYRQINSARWCSRREGWALLNTGSSEHKKSGPP